MIEIETGVVVTGLTSIVGLSAVVGALFQRVKTNEKNIEYNRSTMEKTIDSLRFENREDHKQIFNKLEALNTFVRNSSK